MPVQQKQQCAMQCAADATCHNLLMIKTTPGLVNCWNGVPVLLLLLLLSHHPL